MFDFSSQNVTLPDAVVYGIVYNTTNYGPSPIGTSAPCFTSSGGCPYDSLNIALAPTVAVGSKPFPDTLYQDTIASNYCDLGLAGTGTFRLDSPSSACWEGYIPAVKFAATPPLVGPPTAADQCKKDGWMAFNNPAFKNQGDCVSYVNTGK